MMGMRKSLNFALLREHHNLEEMIKVKKEKQKKDEEKSVESLTYGNPKAKKKKQKNSRAKRITLKAG